MSRCFRAGTRCKVQRRNFVFGFPAMWSSSAKLYECQSNLWRVQQDSDYSVAGVKKRDVETGPEWCQERTITLLPKDQSVLIIAHDHE